MPRTAPRRFAVATVALALLAALAPDARAEGIARTELNRADLSGVPGYEVIVARLEIAPGGVVPRHSHAGDEHLYVLEGGDLTTPNGKTVSFTPGMAITFPRGLVHGGLTGAGPGTVVVITTHVVEKGGPLNIPAE